MDGDRNNGRYEPTPAQRFADAVWRAGLDELDPMEAMVLLLYARAARPGTDSAWLTQHRIMRECKISSSETVVRVRRSLIKKGWLDPIDLVVIRGGRPTVYRLCIPQRCSTTEHLGSPSGSTIEHLRAGSGSITEHLDRRCSTIEQGRTEDVRSPNTLPDESSSTTEHLYGVKVFDPDTEGVRPSNQRCSTIEQRIPPQTVPPVGGAPSRAQAAARPPEPAREAAAPDGATSLQNRASRSGHVPPKDASIAFIRKTISERKPR